MEQIKDKSIKEEVLEKIKCGKAKMRPRRFFVIKTCLSVVGGALFILILLYFISFIFFILRQTGVIFIPTFGFRGLLVFLMSLPWLMVLVAGVFLIFFEIYVKQYSFAYQRPVLYSLIIILIVVLFGGFVVAQVGLHEFLYRHAEQHRLPIAGSLYRGYGHEEIPRVHSGIITKIDPQGFSMKNRKGNIITVHVSSTTHIQLDEMFEIDDGVVVMGKNASGTIEAIGIHNLRRPTILEVKPFTELIQMQ